MCIQSRNNFVSKVAPGRVEELRSANAHKAAHSNIGTGDASVKQGCAKYCIYHLMGLTRVVTCTSTASEGG